MVNHQSVRFDGTESVDIQPTFNKISNNFTYEFWVKPEGEHNPVSQNNSGISGTSAQRYVIVPGFSHDPNCAGTGVSVGTNGVSVFEHTKMHLPAVLVYETLILDWTHIAISYKDKTPTLYVNGVLIKQGFKSIKQNVFASGVFGSHQYGPYKGFLRELRIWDHARTQQQIKEELNKDLGGLEEGLFGYWKFEPKRRYIRDYSLHGNHGVLKGNVAYHFLNVLQESMPSVNLFTYSEVDIIIPIYNAFDCVKQCIQSVYLNTLLPYNLYLINDCSTDTRMFDYLEHLRLSPKPPHLKHLNIIHNKENLGFVKSVNKGILFSENHVILLNSDTEVPSNWTMRLTAPIFLTNNIASVTPFSNSATICSFPNVSEYNPLPVGVTVEEFDFLFEKFGSSQPIEVPTGVGFCMALSRKIVEEIGLFDEQKFGKGYGEENDWCMRAYHAGYKNVMIPNLFVHHKLGKSFSEDPKKREDLRINNGHTLHRMHPDYLPMVQKFTIADPVKPIRDVLKSAAATSDKQGILYIIHSEGGGTEYSQNLRINNMRSEVNCIRLSLESQTKNLVIEDLNQGTKFNMMLDELTQSIFNNMLAFFNVKLINIDQLYTYPVFKLIELIQNCGVDYSFYIHDFYSVCPSLKLLNSQDKYCNAETDVNICQNCISKLFPYVDIINWRNTFQSFLSKAKEIIAPSEDARKIILKYYFDLRLTVQEHQKLNTVRHTFNTEFAQQPEINIAFIGYLTKPKGSEFIFDLLKQIEHEDLPIGIKVIGSIAGENFNYQLSGDNKLEVSGPYKSEDISSLLEKYKISIVIIPALWPETYSWTTSEVMWSGYPVITFNLGAPADRVKQVNGGWIVEEMNSIGILQLLKRLLNSREEILEKASNLKKVYW